VAEFPGTSSVDALQVRTERLDDAVPAGAMPSGPCLLKIDTQGAELSVLEGGPRVLELTTHVLVEISFVELYEGQASAAEVVGYLHERGFGLGSIYDVKTSRLSGEPLQADALFVRA
jgi:hypothetical protein